MIKDFVLPHQHIADIGTDHAYLPIYLAESGHIGKIIATDITDGPISKARANIKAHNLKGRIELRQGDGLSPILPGEADAVIIAGMGGKLICDILDKANWVINQDITLILQPMTMAHAVRRFLAESGFRIDGEVAICEGFRIYTVIRAVRGSEIESDPVYYYVSRAMIERGGEAAFEYIKKIRIEFEKIAKSLLNSKGKQDKIEWYINMANKLKKMEGMVIENEGF